MNIGKLFDQNDVCKICKKPTFKKVTNYFCNKNNRSYHQSADLVFYNEQNRIKLCKNYFENNELIEYENCFIDKNSYHVENGQKYMHDNFDSNKIIENCNEIYLFYFECRGNDHNLENRFYVKNENNEHKIINYQLEITFFNQFEKFVYKDSMKNKNATIEKTINSPKINLMNNEDPRNNINNIFTRFEKSIMFK